MGQVEHTVVCAVALVHVLTCVRYLSVILLYTILHVYSPTNLLSILSMDKSPLPLA